MQCPFCGAQNPNQNIRCYHCGNQIQYIYPDNAMFCHYCGRAIGQTGGRCVICHMPLCQQCLGASAYGTIYCPEHIRPAKACFIATAAYGTPMAIEVNSLRIFRDSKLMNKWIGRRFITTYYAISPPIANFIAEDDRMRAFTRRLLGPVVKIIKKNN